MSPAARPNLRRALSDTFKLYWMFRPLRRANILLLVSSVGIVLTHLWLRHQAHYSLLFVVLTLSSLVAGLGLIVSIVKFTHAFGLLIKRFDAGESVADIIASQ